MYQRYQYCSSGVRQSGAGFIVAVSGGGGGSDFITENFDGGVNDADLAGRTAAVGGTWVDHPHANYPATILFASNRVYSVNAGGAAAAYYNDATPASADYYVQADFYLHSAITQSAGVAGRMDTTADTMYLGRLVDGATWQLRKGVGGSFVTLGSTSTTGVPTAGNSATGRLVMTGDQISFEVVGFGTVIGPITDSAITAAGKAGMRLNGTQTSSTGTHLDNFSAR